MIITPFERCPWAWEGKCQFRGSRKRKCFIFMRRFLLWGVYREITALTIIGYQRPHNNWREKYSIQLKLYSSSSRRCLIPSFEVWSKRRALLQGGWKYDAIDLDEKGCLIGATVENDRKKGSSVRRSTGRRGRVLYVLDWSAERKSLWVEIGLNR